MSPPTANDPSYVREQYANSANLDARIALHQLYSTSAQPFHDWLFDQVQLPPNARVLEVGCGSGVLWSSQRPRISAGWHITLTDFSYGMTETVQEKFPDAQFSFANCDTQALPFPNAQFDAVFANHMLYHVPDLDRGLGEIRRVLKRGGTLYAATNGQAHMRELGELVTELTGLPLRAETPEQLFGLENGAYALWRHFINVTRHVQDNNLNVTSVEPLVAYIKSGWLYNKVADGGDMEKEFRERVRAEIDEKGVFHITKAQGFFIAR